MVYVYEMKSNLISMGQLLEKWFSMNMVNDFLKIYDATKRMIVKAPLARNIIFKVNLNTIKSQCFSAMFCQMIHGMTPKVRPLKFQRFNGAWSSLNYDSKEIVIIVGSSSNQ
ncbi:hypothetical protein VIGAN_04195000 [Vigna angularis var. angularis]|uniref:Uncharacterized protein n=1 Tax=Vigna angularis var. angularis TaxID=157739 RepID=A0A0S3RVD3_PHAAN|nr:hypothetical protein VIGAN_04195000 [Vigna angularis var. angularis]